jgi:glycogen phosphorylase
MSRSASQPILDGCLKVLQEVFLGRNVARRHDVRIGQQTFDQHHRRFELAPAAGPTFWRLLSLAYARLSLQILTRETKRLVLQIQMSSEFQSSLDKSVTGLKALILSSLKFRLARDTSTASKREWWLATSKAAQSIIVERMIATATADNDKNAKRVYYLSLEFLMGRLFSNNLYNAGVIQNMVHALEELGLDYEELREEEYDMGLGNGGLGRLAACFLDSLATLDYPAIGYGIHYQYGLFKQEFRNGYQVELPDAWMHYGTPWEIVRPEQTTEIQVYGYVENVFDDRGNYVSRWMGWRKLVGVPYDIPVPGYGTNTVNFLRLWESRASEEFDFEAFNRGGYEEALREKNHSEIISKVLYPNDKTESGKELRLLQQYFFVACSLKDIIRRFRRTNDDWEDFPEKVAIQLNDTHPAIAVVELHRILHDEYGIAWEKAWSIVTRTFAYTNHTLLPEALEKWSVGLFSFSKRIFFPNSTLSIRANLTIRLTELRRDAGSWRAILASAS